MTMQSVRKKLNANSRNYSFELFGYDFLVDETFKAWLIEINTNPCLEESSKLLKMLLPRMIGNFLIIIIDDALKLTVDQIFPRKRKIEFNIPEVSPHRVDDYSDTENMWEYLCQIGIVKVPINYKSGSYTIHKPNPMNSNSKCDNPLNPKEKDISIENNNKKIEEMKENDNREESNRKWNNK